MVWHLLRATSSVNSMPSFKEVFRLGAAAHAAISPTRKRRPPVRLADTQAAVADTNAQALEQPKPELFVDGTESAVSAVASTPPADIRPHVSSTSDKRDNIAPNEVEKTRYTRLSKRKTAAVDDAQGNSNAQHKKLKSAQLSRLEPTSKMTKRKPQVFAAAYSR